MVHCVDYLKAEKYMYVVCLKFKQNMKLQQKHC